MQTMATTKRESDTGRYAHSDDAPCRCGHQLGRVFQTGSQDALEPQRSDDSKASRSQTWGLSAFGGWG